MARLPNEQGEILKSEDVLHMKYEENNKITKKFMEEINEMKNKMSGYDGHSPADVKHKPKPIRSSEFNTFMKIVDHGDTIEEHKTVSTKEVTVKNYVLQREIDRLNADLLKKDDACDRLQEENRRLTEEKDKCAYQLSLLKEKARKHDREIETLTGTLKTRDTEVGRLLKDMGGMEKRFKHEQIVHEKQRSAFAKTADENKQLRETVKKLEASNKEAEEKHAKTVSRNDEALARCRREKDVLVAGFRKQLELIDSLKRQNTRMKLQEEVGVLENEFGRLLEGK